MKRILMALVIATAATLLAAGPAAAGEITGNGKLTPIKSQQTEDAPAGPANSACAFSGLNDGEDGRTQTWGGALLGETGGGQDVAAAARSGELQMCGPGSSCRGGEFPEEG